MKLLFDENLSPKLPSLLKGAFPGSRHVRECGLKGKTDREIWEYARSDGFVIVSKDSDFLQRSIIHGTPPKIVWLRIGNCTREMLLQLLLRREGEINSLEADPNQSILVLR
jgi:predicted nuclease of predicted toxin-antitoxin system